MSSSPDVAPLSPSALSKLKPSQQVVVHAFVSPSSPGYLNQAQAYKTAHPHVTDGTAKVNGHRTLTKANVRAAVEEALIQSGFSKETLEAELAWNIDTCKREKRMSDHREAVLGLSKLAGHLVDKREDVSNTPRLQEAELRIELEKRLQELQS